MNNTPKKPFVDSNSTLFVTQKIAVTGANGFIGKHLCKTLATAGCKVIPIVRKLSNDSDTFEHCEDQRCIGDISGDVDWAPLLQDVDVVIHAAGVIISPDNRTDADSLYNKVNVEATYLLAKAAANSGVSRFILMSSAGVYGLYDQAVAAIEEQKCTPLDPYAKSKLAAENKLQASGLFETMQLVILRPPMVYGPHSPGNLQKLARMILKPVAVPLGAIDGRRNLLSVWSLCEAIILLLQDTGDATGVWNIAEPDQVSVPEIMQALARGMYGKPVILPTVPASFLKRVATLLGKREMFEKLDNPVLIDGRKFSQRFDWQPTIPTLQGIEQAAKTFRAQR